jgi:preprotein translocase subunit YajC
MRTMSSTTPILDLAVLQGDSGGVSTAAPGEVGSAEAGAGVTGADGSNGAGNEENSSPGLFGNPLFMFALMGAAFYFLLIRPGSKQQKERKAMLSDLKKGDDVMTTGGMIGKIVHITDTRVKLMVADGVRIEFSRQAVQGVVEANEDLPETQNN